MHQQSEEKNSAFSQSRKDENYFGENEDQSIAFTSNFPRMRVAWLSKSLTERDCHKKEKKTNSSKAMH